MHFFHFLLACTIAVSSVHATSRQHGESRTLPSVEESSVALLCEENPDCRQGICYFFPQTCGSNAVCEAIPEFPNFICHAATELDEATCADYGCGDGTKCLPDRSSSVILCVCRNRVVPVGQPCQEETTCSKNCSVTAKCTSNGSQEFCICPNDGRIAEEQTTCIIDPSLNPDGMENNNDGVVETPDERTSSRVGTTTTTLLLSKLALFEPEQKTLLFVLIAVSLAVMFLACCILIFVSMHRSKQKKERSTLQKIFRCMTYFDVEDLDIRRSPAGGYNVSYLNELAKGKNKYEEKEGEDDSDWDE